jgi:type I restriction enzyme S subunit
MKFQAYQEYKNTGIEWFMQIPIHWGFVRARVVGIFSASGIDKKWDDSEIPVRMFNYLDVYNSKDKVLNYFDDLMETTSTAEKILEHSVKKGDLLFTPSSETEDDIGHAALINEIPNNIVFSYHLLRFKPSAFMVPNFLKYLFNSKPIRAYFESVCTGTTRMVLNRDDFKNSWLTLPSYDEQKNIGIFLDHEIAKIDILVTQQEKLIELLKEKRQAVISHAVTNGLNPNAKMRNTEIGWLREVPEHWDIKAIHWVASINDEALKESTDHEYEIEYVDIGSVDLSIGIQSTELLKFKDAPSRARRIVKNGDVIVSTVRTYLKAIAYVKEPPVNMIVSTGFAVIRSKNGLNSNFAKFALQSSNFIDEVISRSTGVSYPAINASELAKIKIPLPPYEEQIAICDFLEKQIIQIDSLISESTKINVLLQERSSALISSVVTGQIDVRNYQIKEAA